MEDIAIRHSFLQVNSSFVHLVQYGLNESLLKPHFDSSDGTTGSSSKLPLNEPIHSRNSQLANNEVDGIIGDSTSNRPNNRLIIFIPGNPGMLGMYHDFLVTLYKTLNDSGKDRNRSIVPILAISHNNFDHPDIVDYPADARYCIEEDELNFAERARAKNFLDEPHHIELQVLNKLIVLKRLLKMNLDDYKIIFVGHSIGCYVIVKLLQDRLVASAHIGSILVHPALENLALTDKGMLFNRLFNFKFDLVIKAAALVLDKVLPKPVKIAVAKWKCSAEYLKNSSNMAIESLAQLACPRSLNATIQMAKSEFALIKNIDANSIIQPHVPKLRLIYAINDHWVNTDNRKMLKELYPDLHIEEQQTLHAFIMDPSTVMNYAVKIALFIQEFDNNKGQS